MSHRHPADFTRRGRPPHAAPALPRHSQMVIYMPAIDRSLYSQMATVRLVLVLGLGLGFGFGRQELLDGKCVTVQCSEYCFRVFS